MNYNLHIKPEEIISKEELICFFSSKLYDNEEREEDIADLLYIKDLLEYDARMKELSPRIACSLEQENYEFLIKLKKYNLVEINKEGKIY